MSTDQQAPQYRPIIGAPTSEPCPFGVGDEFVADAPLMNISGLPSRRQDKWIREGRRFKIISIYKKGVTKPDETDDLNFERWGAELAMLNSHGEPIRPYYPISVGVLRAGFKPVPPPEPVSDVNATLAKEVVALREENSRLREQILDARPMVLEFARMIESEFLRNDLGHLRSPYGPGILPCALLREAGGLLADACRASVPQNGATTVSPAFDQYVIKVAARLLLARARTREPESP